MSAVLRMQGSGSRLARLLLHQPSAKLSSSAILSVADPADGKKNVNVPSGAQVVICGGGVVGCSVAYHLSKMGWTDVVLLEQGSIGCGTTWHAAGLVTRHKFYQVDTAITKYSAELYKELDNQGYNTGWKQCGSLNLAQSKDRMVAYQRALINGRHRGVDGEFLSADEIKERWPSLNTEDLMGGFWIPGDGVVNPTDAAAAMARKAKDSGISILEGVKVQRVLTENRKVVGVETDQGRVDCQYFVNCGGQWARDLGKHKCDYPVRVPLHSCEHFYIVTKPIPGVDKMFPVVRDYDSGVYVREWSGGILGGGFEKKAKPVFHDGVPDKFEFQLLPEDWDHFQELLEPMLHRLPLLAQGEVRQLVNGPESFTPDGKCILGESPEVDNYFIAAGMNSMGIAYGGGVGKIMAEWIVEGTPSLNMWGLDVRRFVDMHNNKKFLRSRVTETLGFSQSVKFWDSEMSSLATGRRLRVSPLFTRMEKQGVFGQMMGYERPLYFERDHEEESEHYRPSVYRDSQLSSGLIADDDDFSATEPLRLGTFGRPAWFDNVKSEYWSCREGVSLIDMSTFSKFELRSAGNEAVEFLEYMCSNSIDKPVGHVVHTGMHNVNGGYENDCSVVRLAHNKFFMISPSAQQTRAYAWLRRHLPSDGSVQLSDVTSMYTAINVIGPRAKDLLAELTDAKLDSKSFFSMSCKEIDVGQASGVKAMRLTHSGEDGWMLYIPAEYAIHVYDSLMQAGKNYGIRNAGYFALRALRTEKFYAYWGSDLTCKTTPLECGREYRVKFDKEFLGREALLKQKAEGVKQRLVQFILGPEVTDNDVWPWGGEPIFRNGKFCGQTTSTAFGFTLDRHVCLGYVSDYREDGERNCITNDFILKGGQFEVDIAGRRFPAKVTIYPRSLPSAEIKINTNAKSTT